MGGICSKRSKVGNPFHEANGQFDRQKSDRGGYKPGVKAVVMQPPPVVLIGAKEKQLPQPAAQEKAGTPHGRPATAPAEEDFYDGIPRYSRALSQKSRSVRSTHSAVAKVWLFSVFCASIV